MKLSIDESTCEKSVDQFGFLEGSEDAQDSLPTLRGGTWQASKVGARDCLRAWQVRNIGILDLRLEITQLESKLGERVEREAAVIKWTVATFLAGVLNYLLLYRIAISVILYSTNIPPSIANVYEDPIMFWLIEIGLYLGLLFSVFLVPLFCSAIASQLLPEKRFVAPVDITLVTIGLLVFQLHLANWPMPQTGLGALASLFLFVCGMFDELIAHSLVGRGERPTHHHTVKVKAPIHDIDVALNAPDIRRTFSFEDRRQYENGNLMIYSFIGISYRFYVVLAANPDDSTMIHFEAYDVSRYVIEGTQEGKREFDRNVRDISSYLMNEKGWTVMSATYDETFPFKEDVDAVIFAPSHSKLANLSHLPKRTVAILLAVGALASAAYLFYIDQKLTAESFLLTMLGLGSLIVGLLPFMKWTGKDE